MKAQKINGHPISYYINEKQRVVCAVIHDCRLDVAEYFLNQHFGILPTVGKRVSNTFLLPGTLKSIATAHPEDKFDIEVGKRIASKRLRKKYWLKYADRMFQIIEFIQAETYEMIDDAKRVLGMSESIDPLAEIQKGCEKNG